MPGQDLMDMQFIAPIDYYGTRGPDDFRGITRGTVGAVAR